MNEELYNVDLANYKGAVETTSEGERENIENEEVKGRESALLGLKYASFFVNEEVYSRESIIRCDYIK